VPERNDWSYPTLTITYRVMVDTAGSYKAVVRYKNSGKTQKNYKLNKATDSVMLQFMPTTANQWNTATKDIQLQKGMNWIVLKSENNQVDDIAVDYLKILK
jgi:tartrate dehydratase beta subunit/fumarate hydratase class I family protein